MPEPLPDNPLGVPFVELDSVDSTNNYALSLIHAGLALHGQAFFAWEQYAGKGQRGKSWQSEKGNNLIISIIINPLPLTLTQQFRLSACLAVGTADWFARYAGDATRIKWPNDLYWHDRKAGGILIESVAGTTDDGLPVWKWAVGGVGININQVSFHSSLSNPVSLRQITGKSFSPDQLARELCRELELQWKKLTRNGFEPILERYNDLLFRKGEKYRFRHKTRVFEARILRVDADGRLWLDEGMEVAYEHGSISFEMADAR